MKRVSSIVIPVVGWTMLVGTLAVLLVVQSHDVECALGGVIGPDAEERFAQCLRQAAEMKGSRTLELVFLVALWVAGLIVAGPIILRDMAARRVPK